jgi:hypothetical protein
METLVLNIYNIVGSASCLTAEDGEKVHVLLEEAIDNNQKVILSFQNVETLADPFLETAIGQIYRDHDKELVKELIEITDISLTGKVSLKSVVTAAKLAHENAAV